VEDADGLDSPVPFQDADRPRMKEKVDARIENEAVEQPFHVLVVEMRPFLEVGGEGVQPNELLVGEPHAFRGAAGLHEIEKFLEESPDDDDAARGIFHVRQDEPGGGHPPEETVTLHQEHPRAVPGRRHRRGNPSGTAADHDDIPAFHPP